VLKRRLHRDPCAQRPIHERKALSISEIVTPELHLTVLGTGTHIRGAIVPAPAGSAVMIVVPEVTTTRRRVELVSYLS
jgi:hypothetical protein